MTGADRSGAPESPTARTLRLLREEWTKPYRDALEELTQQTEGFFGSGNYSGMHRAMMAARAVLDEERTA